MVYYIIEEKHKEEKPAKMAEYQSKNSHDDEEIDKSFKPEDMFLYYAVGKRSVEMTRESIKKGADINCSSSKSGYTPLHMAVVNNFPEIVKELLSHNADVNHATLQGETPLHTAVIKNFPEIVKELLSNNADVNRVTSEGYTPLSIAALYGYIDIAQSLMKSNKIDTDNDANILIQTLHLAAMSGHVEVIKYLIQNGVSVDAKDYYGATALHYSAEGGHLEAVKVLISNEADINIKTNDDQTPLHYASLFGEVRGGSRISHSKWSFS